MIPQNQRSAEWFRWRRDKIGSSCASSIMGCGFKSIGALWEEKLGLRSPEDPNEAMKRGNELEEEARAAFEKETGLSVFPMVCVSAELPWQIASMDGMTIEKDVGVEIKCQGATAYQKTINEGIPAYYIPQLQHQMSVTGLNEIYFYSYYSRDESFITKLPRDDSYIEMLIEREKQFMKLLNEGRRLIKFYEDSLDTLKDELYKIVEENNVTMYF